MSKLKDKVMNRRDVLKRASATAVGAIAAPYVITSTALGAASAAPASQRITIGMIGMGRQARGSNVRFFLGAPDAQVVAVCDVDAWRLDNGLKDVRKHYAGRASAGTYSGCKAYGDYREVLARDDIDAVMISTPDHWHVPQAIAAARAGKDICCEKPLTLSVNEGRALSDVASRYGRVFRTDSEFRSHWYFHRQCELVRNGRIGKLHTIRTGVPRGDVGCAPQPTMPVPPELDYDMWLGPAPVAPYTLNRVHTPRSYARPGWMRCRDTCDGMITNWGTHLNDIAQWGHNTDHTGPVEVVGTGVYPADGLWGVLTSFDVHYRFADGVVMHYVMGYPHVRFEGDAGWIQANYGGKLTASSPDILKSKIGPDEVHLRLKHEKRDFLDCIKTRGRTLADAEVGHRTNTLCHLGHIAIQVGRKLQWDPAAETFPNDGEANRLCDRPYREPWGL